MTTQVEPRKRAGTRSKPGSVGWSGGRTRTASLFVSSYSAMKRRVWRRTNADCGLGRNLLVGHACAVRGARAAVGADMAVAARTREGSDVRTRQAGRWRRRGIHRGSSDIDRGAAGPWPNARSAGVVKGKSQTLVEYVSLAGSRPCRWSGRTAHRCLYHDAESRLDTRPRSRQEKTTMDGMRVKVEEVEAGNGRSSSASDGKQRQCQQSNGAQTSSSCSNRRRTFVSAAPTAVVSTTLTQGGRQKGGPCAFSSLAETRGGAHFYG